MIKEFFKKTLMPEPPEDMGEVHVEWVYPEFPQFNRSKSWYIMAGIAVTAMMVYAVFTMNFLFAIILLLLVLILILQHYRTPENISVKVTQDGILMGSRFYPYEELTSFWFVYQPPAVKNMYLDFKSEMKRSLAIPLDDANPVEVRAALLNYLDENLEDQKEYFDEKVSRLIKFQ